MKIYDYDNNPTEISVLEDEIEKIYVNVLTGDETGYIIMKDGNKINFDASDYRKIDHHHGSYTLMGDDIKKWIEFDIDENGTISYQRRDTFSY